MIKYKEILILLIFFGVVFMVIEVVKTEQKCPEQKIIYRYIPRSFEEEQEEPVYVSDIFRVMFENPSPWENGVDQMDMRKNEAINKYFVSQI
jgi:hypothetical protein